MSNGMPAIEKYLERQGYRPASSFEELVMLAEIARKAGQKAKYYADNEPVAYHNASGVITPDLLAVHVRYNPSLSRWEIHGRVIEKKGGNRVWKSLRYLNKENQDAMREHLARHGIRYRGVWVVKGNFKATASNGTSTRETRLRQR
jgi:hypothetical protein